MGWSYQRISCHLLTMYRNSKAYLQNFITQCAESHHQVFLNVSRILQTGGLTRFFFRKQKTMVWSKLKHNYKHAGDGIKMETEATNLAFTTYFNLFQIAAWEPLLYNSTLQLGVIYPVGLVIYMCGIIWLELIISSAYTHRFCAV